MPPVLDDQKQTIDRDRHHDQEDGLKGRKRGPWRGFGEVRQHQAEHRQRHDQRQKRISSPEVVFLLAVAKAAQQQRDPDHAIEHNHHHAEHRVACQRGFALPGQHDRRDHHHFDADDGKRKHQCAQGLAQPYRQALSVMHDGKGCTHDDGKEPNQHQGEPERIREIGEPPFAKQQKRSRRGEGHRQQPLPPQDPKTRQNSCSSPTRKEKPLVSILPTGTSGAILLLTLLSLGAHLGRSASPRRTGYAGASRRVQGRLPK